MKTITFDEKLFENSVLQLWERVGMEFIPEKVIVIESGGGYLADVLVKNRKLSPTDIVRIKTTRKLTRVKKSHGKTLIKFFPGFINILLRKIESYSKEFIFMFFKLKEERVVDVISGEFSEIVGKKVLILDDAVDSGVTLKSVFEFVESNSSNMTEIKSAALTVTFKNPLIFPNYFVYKRTLIRFPWAIDVAK